MDNISQQNGVVELAFSGDVPWHHLGTQVDSTLTVEEMMEEAHINFVVHEEPVFRAPRSLGGGTQRVPGHKIIWVGSRIQTDGKRIIVYNDRCKSCV